MNRLRISWICGVLFLVLSLSASAQPEWTRVGSTGTIDEISTSAFAVSGAALLHSIGSLTQVVARFNVDNVSGMFPLAPWKTLELTSQDGSPQGSVFASLIRVPRCGGTPFLVCTAQSIDTVQGPTCTQCSFAAALDFANNSYYVEVSINRSNAGVTPALFGLRLF